MVERVLRSETATAKLAGKKPSVKRAERKQLEFFDDVFKREILNREQASFFTTLSVEVLDKAVERGDLMSHSEGARVLFLREELVDFIRRCPAKSRKRQQKETA